MVALFKDRSPATIIWLFILSIIVHSHFFVDSPVIAASPDDGLLGVFLKEYAAGLNPVVSIFLYHAIVFLQALRLNYLFTDHRMYSKVNYLAAMVYVLLTGVFTEWNTISPALIDNTLVIMLFTQVIKLNNTHNPKTLIFNIGLIIGVSIILYHPSALLIPVAFFALMELRPFVVNEWFILPMGIISPYYFLASYLYLTDKLGTIKKYLPALRFNISGFHPSIVFFVTIALLLMILLIGLLYSPQENRRLLINVRKNWTVLVVMVFFMLPQPFINKNTGVESWLLWIVPASPFIAKAFLVPKKNTIPSLLFWSLIALSVLKNWQIIR